MSNKKTVLLLAIVIVSAFFIGHFRGNDDQRSQLALTGNDEAKRVIQQSPKIKKFQPIIDETDTLISQKQPKVKQCFAPLLSEVTTAEKTNSKYTHYYDLKTNLSPESGAFIKELNHKLYLTFEHIEDSFNIQLMRKTSLHLIYLADRTSYEDYLMAKGRSPEGSIGAYLYPEHLSVVELTDYKQGILSSLHEAIHAFNQSYWGETLRFFNEGMAEYYENITMEGKFKPFDFSKVKDQVRPMQISVLLFSEVDWHGDNKTNLYHNSNALFHFLMSNKQGRNVIWEIMNLERKDSCSVLTKDEVIDLLFDIYPNHQQEFDYWFEEGIFKYFQKINQ